MGASSSSPLAACLLCVFLGGFSRPSVCYGFSLLFFWPSCPSVSGLFTSGAVSGPLVLSVAVVPGSLIPLQCLTFRRLTSVPVCPRDSYGLDGFVLRTLRWCSAVSLLFVGLLLVLVRPVLFLFSVSFCPFLGALLSELSSFLDFWSPLGSPFRSVAMSFGLLLAAGSVFLPSLPGWSVRSPGSPRLWRSLWSGVLFHWLSLFCAFGGGGARSSSPCYFVEGFREWHFDAQWSPGLANSL